VKAHERGRVSPGFVADQLAEINHEVSQRIADNSVGPRCIVGWRNRRGGVHRGGGGHQCYTGTIRESSSPPIPTIGVGMDITALGKVLMANMMKKLEGKTIGHESFNLMDEEVQAEINRLPDTPDEELR